MVDAFRAVTLVLCSFVVVAFPWATVTEGRAEKAWPLVLGAEIIIIGSMAAIIAHFGEPIRWYRTPLVFVGSALMTYYIVKIIRSLRWR